MCVLVMQGKRSMTGVADLRDMHCHTLNRRLTLSSAAPRSPRTHIARQLVADTTLSMIEIASTLNCSDASTFTRAFRRWTDMSPCEWRSRLKKSP